MKNKKIKLIRFLGITILRIETYNKEKRIHNKISKTERKAKNLQNKLDVLKLKNEVR